MLLGIDAGNARVKVCGSAGAIDFDAALGEWRQRNLINDHGLDDMEVDYAGKRYFAGSLARCESEFGNPMATLLPQDTPGRCVLRSRGRLRQVQVYDLPLKKAKKALPEEPLTAPVLKLGQKDGAC